ILLGISTVACSTAPKEPSASSPVSVTPSPTVAPTLKPTVAEVVFLQPGEIIPSYMNGISGVNAVLEQQQIQITVKRYPTNQYRDKVGLLVSGGVNFDLFSVNEEFGTLPSAVKEGLAVPVTPDAELKALFPEPLWKNAEVSGDICGVPVFTQKPNGFPELLGVHTDVLHQAGYENFPSEYVASALQYMQGVLTKEGETPTSFTWLGTPESVPLWLHQTYGGEPFSVDNFMNLLKITENGTVSSFYESDEFRRDADHFRDFYHMDLIDSDIVSVNANAALKSGKALPSQGYNDENAVGEDLSFVKLGENKPYVTSLGKNFTCVSKTSRQPEKALEFLSWLYASQENFDLFHYGTKGKDYTVNEAGRITRKGDSYGMDISLTGYRPFLRYEENISENYRKAVMADSPDAVLARSATFVFDNTGLEEPCRLLAAAVKEQIYPIKFGIVPYGDHIRQAIEALYSAGLQEYISAYQEQYAAFLKLETA
ncbi:MAG: extracellular solute-binding protein, partial [Oscillospiraceae bacterium]